jgi:hypothetical protein
MRGIDYDAMRDLIVRRELRGEIDEPPVAATKPGAEPAATGVGGAIRLYERSSRLREILLQHPEAFDDDWQRLKRVSAEDFNRMYAAIKPRDDKNPESAQWAVVLTAAMGCLLLGIVCGVWLARKRSSVANDGNR